jgi:hypothetical protein
MKKVSGRDAVRRIPLAKASPTLGCSAGRIWLRKNGRRDACTTTPDGRPDAPAAQSERAFTYWAAVRGCDDFSGVARWKWGFLRVIGVEFGFFRGAPVARGASRMRTGLGGGRCGGRG